ncbi:ankyrin repeat, SAM and basic leucine zipper domain-containing protein 1 [Leguminivora glycinivorella]|uniref:ankyrin repeat, SAM and basic leucine zipper domain-containing protein 1 n=1 Tax=Leguminivora glycinivorella TaxID=1035111 RepID=UPI00200F46B4|nr:ankyrin repeat, SAM and basic leucine zipper domain-containing protein 1 [Leguminivora glycinivorella]
MPTFRPAGLSDSDSDSDDYGFEKPARRYNPVPQQNILRRTENILQEAIINSNLEEVKAIISNDSVTPVMVACSNSSASNEAILNIFISLVEKGCLLNIGDKYGQTPLMRAISSGRDDVVQKLIDAQVNIEMRDQQGWTALFWAVHHNQPEILKLLIENGARLREVDKNSRTPLDIAHSHDHQNVIDILSPHFKTEDRTDDNVVNDISSWHDFYPGIERGFKPTYSSEIRHLLYGMSCERLGPLIHQSGIDLKTFLLLDADGMVKIGINMPFERHRLEIGLRNFHSKGWNLNSVAGLYAQKHKNYSVLDCLTTLGTHLQQIYILETTIQYALREYKKVQDQIKFEPPDSPLLTKFRDTAKKLIANINNIRGEMKIMKSILIKVNKKNPKPADLIKERSLQEVVLCYSKRAVLIGSLGLAIRYMLPNLVKK